MGIKQDLTRLMNPEKAKTLLRFFKTGPGEYGEGDRFLGVTVPAQREVAKKYSCIGLDEIKGLLSDKTHECRLTALIILSSKYQKSSDAKKRGIVEFYLKNTRTINNWDLVDLSAPNILGKHLLHSDRKILYKLARSPSLWERRIAIISTLTLIRANEFCDTLKISKILLKDKEDLIHKAVGWMLREVGKKSESCLESFLKKHYIEMPRTMLRYAIERLSPQKRRFYLG